MKREELTAMGLTDEQIEKIIAENSKDVQAANAKANKNSEELTRLRELEKEYTAMKDKDLSDSERLQKDLDSANAKIAELEKTQAIADQRSNAASKFLLNRHHRLSRMTAVLTTKYSEKLSLIKRLLRHRLKSRKLQTEPQIRAVVVLAVVMELKVKVLKWQRNIISAM